MRALLRLLLLVLIPLLIVMAVRDPQAIARLTEMVFTVGARLLDATATFLDILIGGHAR